MHIDWTSFTPWASLAGGLLIGLATTVFLLGDGRIAGISGIVGGPLRAVVRERITEIDWTRLAFVAGLLVAPWLWRVFAARVASRVDVSTAAMVAAGLLVIDLKLVGGDVLFGVGWGIGGYCPGPALVALGGGNGSATIFVIAMLVGMTVHDTIANRQ